jgi:hypothetical protein
MAINLIIFPIVYILCFILFLRERRGHLWVQYQPVF